MCKSKVFKYCYTIACISTSFGMTVLWMCRYSLDEDSVKIDLKQFHFLEGRYPIISVCLIDPFVEPRIKKYNNSLSGEKYRELLIGDKFSSQIEEIIFEDVTLNLADYYIGDDVYFRNGTYKQGESPNFIHEIPQMTYTGFYGLYFFKCYGLKSKSSSWSHETDFHGATFSFNKVWEDESQKMSQCKFISKFNKTSLRGFYHHIFTHAKSINSCRKSWKIFVAQKN